MFPTRSLILALGLLAAGCATHRPPPELSGISDAPDEVLSTSEALRRIASVRDARQSPILVRELLHHDDPLVRAEALRAVGLVGSLDGLNPVFNALRDCDAGVRSQAAFALSLIPTWGLSEMEARGTLQRAEAELLDVLADEDPAGLPLASPYEAGGARSFQQVVVRALGQIGGPDTRAALWERLAAATSPGLQVDLLLARGIQARRGAGGPVPAAGAPMLRPLPAAPGPARWAAAWLIARAGVGEGVELAQVVAGAADEATDADARAWLLRATGAVGGEDAVGVLARAAAPSRAHRDRVSAVRGAGALGEAGLPVLAGALGDADALVAGEAAAALARLGGDLAWEELLTWEPLPELASDRLDALSAFAGDPGRAEAVLAEAVAALAAPDGRLRAAAWGAAGAVPGHASLGVLLDGVAREQHPSARLALGLALAARPKVEVQGPLLTWVLGDDEPLAALAAEALGEREGADVTARLIESLRASPGALHAERRQAIAAALMARPDADEALLQELLDDEEFAVRQAAWAAWSQRQGYVTTTTRVGPRPRPLVELADPWFGVEDVRAAVLHTELGDVRLRLLPRVAPGAVANFVALAEQGYYDGVVFHRVVADFVIQAGDPRGDGWGGPGYTIRCEYSDLPYRRGTLGMARSGKDTGGSQWFITHSPQPQLEGRYTIWGQVEQGLDVVDALRRGHRILSVDIERSTP